MENNQEARDEVSKFEILYQDQFEKCATVGWMLATYLVDNDVEVEALGITDEQVLNSILAMRNARLITVATLNKNHD